MPRREGENRQAPDLMGPMGQEGLNLYPGAVRSHGRDLSKEETWGEGIIRGRLLQ